MSPGQSRTGRLGGPNSQKGPLRGQAGAAAFPQSIRPLSHIWGSPPTGSALLPLPTPAVTSSCASLTGALGRMAAFGSQMRNQGWRLPGRGWGGWWGLRKGVGRLEGTENGGLESGRLRLWAGSWGAEDGEESCEAGWLRTGAGRLRG